jgi:hypothetical protein
VGVDARGIATVPWEQPDAGAPFTGALTARLVSGTEPLVLPSAAGYSQPRSVAMRTAWARSTAPSLP